MILGILQRYLIKYVVQATGLIFLIVLALAFIISLLGEMKDIGTGDYRVVQALIHSLLILPHTLYLFFPMLILLGGVVGLGTLAANQELIVMRTAGFSVNRIIFSVMLAAVILILGATVIGEYIAPKADLIADKRKTMAENEGQAVATASGLWIHEGNNFVHVAVVLGRYHLEGVTRYEFNENHQLVAAYYAKSLDFVKHQWELHDLVKTSLKKNHTQTAFYPHATWNLKITPNLLNVGLTDPEAMSLPKLAEYSNYLKQNGVQASRLQFEFWKRLLQPLATLVMILLAIPFVFARPRSLTMGLRILFSIVIGFIFYILNAFLGQFSIVFQLSPFFAALFPILLFGGVGYILMRRIR